MGPNEVYAERVRTGLLRPDEHQRNVVAQDLQPLYDALLAYTPPPVPDPLVETKHSSRSGFLGKLFGGEAQRAAPVPEIPDDVPSSLYLHGDVGCGKTMLMDMFYESLPQGTKRRRVHFHAVRLFT